MQTRSRKWFVVVFFLLAGAWFGHTIAGEAAAKSLADLLGDKLQAAANGKFDDPVRFIHGRFQEVLLLATVFAALIALCGWIWRLTARPGIREVRGLAMGLVVFLTLNLFVLCASRTAVFWMLFYSKTHINNLVQYQIKKCLLDETVAKQRLILLGNSQANRAIDERIINRVLGDRLWATEMTQPGARGFDLLTLSRDITPSRGDLVVCYVSEISFYGTGSGIVAADFASFGDLPDLFRMDGFRWMQRGAVRSGLIGRLLPIYRFHEPLACRVLGWDITNIDQTQADSSVQMDFEAQAREWAPKLRIGESSRFEQRSFSLMIDEICSRGSDVLVIAGHLHPWLRNHMDPALQADFARFLEQLKKGHPQRVSLLSGEYFFHANESDFKDLVHFSDTAQTAFTHRLIHHVKTTTPGNIRAGVDD